MRRSGAIAKDRIVGIDNYASHKNPKVIESLRRHPRWTFHVTPTSAYRIIVRRCTGSSCQFETFRLRPDARRTWAAMTAPSRHFGPSMRAGATALHPAAPENA
jgi:hypothetical protein